MKKLIAALSLLGISTICFPQSITTILQPKYAAAGAAGSRTPTTCRLKISGLAPGTVYKYYSGASTLNNAGAAALKGGSYFIENTPAGLNVKGYMNRGSFTGNLISSKAFNTSVTGGYDEFISSPSGDYTGWFSVVLDNSFVGGNTIYFYVVITNGVQSVLNTGVPIQVRDFASTFGGMGQPYGGLPLFGTSFTTDEQMVVLWDNPNATGSPVSVTWLENDGVTVPGSFNSWYTAATGVDGRSGKWAALLPSNSPDGIQRIDYYNGSGQINYSHIDINNDADWCSIPTDWQGGGTTPTTINGTNVEKLIVNNPISLATDLAVSTGNPVGSLQLNADLTVNPFRLVLNQTNILGTGKLITDATTNLEFQGSSSLGVNVIVPSYISVLNNLKINNPAGIYLGADLKILGQLDMSTAPGRLYLNDKTLELVGPAIIPSTAGISSTANSSIIFSGNATGVFLPAECWQLKNLTIKNPNGITINGNTTVYQSVVFENGAAIQTQSYDLFVQGDILGDGKQLNTAPSGRVLLSNTNNYIQKLQGTFANLEINSGASFQGDVITQQKLSISGSNVEIGPNKLTIGGIWTGDASKVIGTPASTIEFAGSVPQTFPITAVNVLDIGTLIINNPTTVDLSATITLSKALVLQQGNFRDNGKTINLKGDIRGSATHSGPGKIYMSGNAVKSFISDATLGNLELNSSNNFELNGTFTGDTKIAGQLNLITGRLDVVNKGLYFIGNTAIPVIRTNGTVNTTKQSSLGFGMKTVKHTGSAFSLPVGMFNLSSTSPTRTSGGVELGTFVLNRTNDITLRATEPFDIHKLLSIVEGNLILPNNYQLDMKSNSISETAMFDVIVNPLTAKITYGTNSYFCVERFLPKDIDAGAGRRVSRELAPGVINTVGSMWSNWQEGAPATPIVGVGIHISGKKGPLRVNDPATGLDMTTTGENSAYTYWTNPSTGLPSWVPVTNTKTIEFNGLLPYRVLARGDRYYQDWSNMQYMNTAVKLRAKGKLIIGDVNITKTGASAPTMSFSTSSMRMNSGKATGSTMIANPYAAAVSWKKLIAHNSTVTDTYTIFDPNVNSLGGYVNYKNNIGTNIPTSAANDAIQPGQAFFVKNKNTTNSSFTFSESDKTIDPMMLTAVFKMSNNKKQTGSIQKIQLGLIGTSDASLKILDGTVIVYDSKFSNDIDSDDVLKSSNPQNNIAVFRSGKQVSIETRNLLQTGDSIPVQLNTLVTGESYQLYVSLKQIEIPVDMEPVLLDKYSKEQIKLSATEEIQIPFTPTADPSSYKDRFVIVFRTVNVLPLNFIGFTARDLVKEIELKWNVSEDNVAYYTVQKSIDGKNFVDANKQSSKGNGLNIYNWLDTYPDMINYYRIIAIDKNGDHKFSQIIRIEHTNLAIDAKVYPNPASDYIIIHSGNLGANSINAKLINANGQVILNEKILNSNNPYRINISHVAAGKYSLQLESGITIKKLTIEILR